MIRKFLNVTSALLLVLGALLLSACSTTGAATSNEGSRVLVAGATGGTGRALVRNLQEQGYTVRAFVRDEAKARVVLGDDLEYAVGDVREIATISAAMSDVDFVISSIGASRADPTNNPEAVDFGGTKNIADAAAQANVKQVVIVSSSGATQEDHFLNKNFDNVLIWKFKGEEAVRASGIPYTIVRPGGLVNSPGGVEELVFAQGDTSTGRISRGDVARVCVAAIQIPESKFKTFEVFSTEKPGQNDWVVMFEELDAD